MFAGKRIIGIEFEGAAEEVGGFGQVLRLFVKDGQVVKSERAPVLHFLGILGTGEGFLHLLFCLAIWRVVQKSGYAEEEVQGWRVGVIDQGVLKHLFGRFAPDKQEGNPAIIGVYGDQVGGTGKGPFVLGDAGLELTGGDMASAHQPQVDGFGTFEVPDTEQG